MFQDGRTHTARPFVLEPSGAIHPSSSTHPARPAVHSFPPLARFNTSSYPTSNYVNVVCRVFRSRCTNLHQNAREDRGTLREKFGTAQLIGVPNIQRLSLPLVSLQSHALEFKDEGGRLKIGGRLFFILHPSDFMRKLCPPQPAARLPR